MTVELTDEQAERLRWLIGELMKPTLGFNPHETTSIVGWTAVGEWMALYLEAMRMLATKEPKRMT